MNLPILGKVIDERFLNHRLRSSSLAGIIGAFVALGLFEYRYYVKHVWSWDLFAVVVTMVAIKLALMAWFRWTD